MKVGIDVIPFTVPSGVFRKVNAGQRQDGFKAPELIMLSELDDETLHQLCDEFVVGVFKKARPERYRPDFTLNNTNFDTTHSERVFPRKGRLR